MPIPGTLRVAAACLNQIPLDWSGNRARIIAVLRAAKAQEVGILCLPELCLTGYGCEDAFLGADVTERAETELSAILPETAGLVVCVGLPRLHHRALFNTAALIVDGKVLGFVAKRHLAGDGLHYEPRWFKAWQDVQQATSLFAGMDLPLGDLIFEVGGIRIGFEICEDAWVADRPGARLAAHGVDVLLNPSASHFAFGKRDVRRGFVSEGSRAFGVIYCYANLLGNEAGRTIYDGGALIAEAGRIIAEGPRLTYREWELTVATVDLARTRAGHTRTASVRPALSAHAGLVRCTHVWKSAGAPTVRKDPAAWEDQGHSKEEEFTRAVALGLFDYLRKSHSHGFVVSLSGGADSAAVVSLVALMVHGAIADLGFAGVCERLAYIPGLTSASDARGLVQRLLTTLYQGTANSSTTTRTAARDIATALGAEHLEIEVDDFVNGYVRTIGNALGRQPTWASDDIAMQNIQARARAPGVWLIANLRNALLLATSNRSEAAVGYATMDGDTCGGLSPIAGIDKAFLRQWLSWLETTGPQGHGPLPVLACVNQQRSTPELRPLDAGQESEEDLMPFPILDRIERLAIRDKLAPAEVLERLVAELLNHPRAQLRGWVTRFFQLWCRNQWKRERFAPAFHLDDENLDPKTWCRFPILSSGFREELAALR